MNPSQGQPSKEQLEALAFRLIKEKDTIETRLTSVKQLISQIENQEFLANMQKGSQPEAKVVEKAVSAEKPVDKKSE